MEVKKNSNADLEKWKNTFLLIGLILSLGFVLYAFEWSSSAGAITELEGTEDIVIEDEQIPITRQDQPKPPPPPPAPKVSEVLSIVEDDVEIEEEFEMEDIEADEDTEIEQVEEVVEEEEEQVFFIVENMPEFPGGERALRTFIGKNVRYPTIARENNIQGKVYIRFVVTETGSVSKVTVARGVDPLLDAEAVRVVKNLPKWKAGEQRGKKVKVWYTVPINFQLQ